MYIQADGSLAAGMLYLRGGPEHRDDHWMMVDKGTGLPVWIDYTHRSARGSLGTAEALGQAIRTGLRLEILKNGPAPDGRWRAAAGASVWS